MITVPPRAGFAVVPMAFCSGFAGRLSGTLSFGGRGLSVVGTKRKRQNDCRRRQGPPMRQGCVLQFGSSHHGKREGKTNRGSSGKAARGSEGGYRAERLLKSSRYFSGSSWPQLSTNREQVMPGLLANSTLYCSSTSATLLRLTSYLAQPLTTKCASANDFVCGNL